MTKPEFQILALNLKVKGARTFSVGGDCHGIYNCKETAQTDLDKLKRLQVSPAYPLHGHSLHLIPINHFS